VRIWSLLDEVEFAGARARLDTGDLTQRPSRERPVIGAYPRDRAAAVRFPRRWRNR